MSATNIKKRNWGAVVYPESAPEDWKEILKLKGMAWACSPLHNQDITDEVSKEKKKEHYHIILSFANPSSFNSVNAIMKELNQPIPIPLESVKGYYRYFTHKDNPEKYQYNENDIEVYNGFDVCDVLNAFEVFQSLKQIQAIVIENNILEYSILMDFLMTTDQMELWNVACSHTLFLNTYITSKRNNVKDQLKTQK